MDANFYAFLLQLFSNYNLCLTWSQKFKDYVLFKRSNVNITDLVSLTLTKLYDNVCHKQNNAFINCERTTKSVKHIKYGKNKKYILDDKKNPSTRLS